MLNAKRAIGETLRVRIENGLARLAARMERSRQIDAWISALCGATRNHVSEVALERPLCASTGRGERLQRLFQGKPVATVICRLTGNRRG